MLPNSETTDDLGSPDPLSMGFPEPLKARPQRPTTVHHNSTACKTSHNFWIRFPTKTIQKKQLNTMLNYSYHQLSNNLSSSMVKSCQSHGICGIAPIKSSEMGIFKVSPVNSMWQSLDATGEWSARLRANTTKLRGVPWCSCFEKFKLDDPMDFLEL